MIRTGDWETVQQLRDVIRKKEKTPKDLILIVIGLMCMGLVLGIILNWLKA
jgi:hypothetical protein